MQNIYQAKGETLIDQYRDVGALFGESIRKSVHKIGRKRSRLMIVRRNVAERTWRHLQTKPVAQSFCECLRAWSEGARVSPEQAMWCVADNLSGCQTMMARYQSGVALLHTEEEFRDNPKMELHMTNPHTMEFRDGATVLKTLVYNDLIPGAGLYGWKKDMIVGVDSLFLREDGIEKVETPLLANVVSWIVWRMKPSEADPEAIVRMADELGELVDGYVLNIVRKVGDLVEGYKLTLARSEHYVEYLGDKPGNYLRQVNIVDPIYPPLHSALPPKKIWRGGWKYFTNRLKTIDQHAQKYQSVSKEIMASMGVEVVHSQIQQAIFGDLRDFYVNVDMGAACVGLVDSQAGTSVSCKLNDDKDLSAIEYLDLVKS